MEEVIRTTCEWSEVSLERDGSPRAGHTRMIDAVTLDRGADRMRGNICGK